MPLLASVAATLVALCFLAICFLYRRSSRHAANMRRSRDRCQLDLQLLASEGR